MTRTQTACYSLLASAFILAALVLVQASHFVNSDAQAEMAINKDTITLVTAQFRGDSEILYVLDGDSERLLAYQVDPNRNTIQLLPGGSLNVRESFDQLARNRGDGDNNGRRGGGRTIPRRR